MAFRDYNSAYRLAPSPIINACQGYCLSRTKYHKDAIAAYRAALECGYDSPALLYNNIGFSCLALGQNDDAERSLRHAIQLDGNLQAARYNMVRVFLQRAVKGQPIPKVAFAHATRALEIGPCTADLYYRVAALYATAAKRDPTFIQPAIEHVGKAVELGFKPEAFTSDIRYSALQKESAFRDALKKPATVSKSSKAVQLAGPARHAVAFSSFRHPTHCGAPPVRGSRGGQCFSVDLRLATSRPRITVPWPNLRLHLIQRGCVL